MTRLSRCGTTFTAQRSTRRYCTDACRQAHHRGDTPKTWRPCQALDCPNHIPPWTRADARYCTPQCRDRDYFAYSRPILPRSWTSADLADLLDTLNPKGTP